MRLSSHLVLECEDGGGWMGSSASGDGGTINPLGSMCEDFLGHFGLDPMPKIK